MRVLAWQSINPSDVWRERLRDNYTVYYYDDYYDDYDYVDVVVGGTPGTTT